MNSSFWGLFNHKEIAQRLYFFIGQLHKGEVCLFNLLTSHKLNGWHYQLGVLVREVQRDLQTVLYFQSSDDLFLDDDIVT